MSPDNPSTLHSFGLVLTANRRFEEAEKKLRRSLALRPNDPHVLCSLGDMLDDDSRCEEAIEAYEHSLSLVDTGAARNNLAVALCNFGCILMSEGEEEDEEPVVDTTQSMSVRELKAFVKATGGSTSDCVSKADLRARAHELFVADTSDGTTLCRLGEAIAAFERSLEIVPARPATLHNLGCALLTDGRVVDAVDALRRSLAVRPAHPPTLNVIGKAFILSRQYEEAVEVYEKSIEIVSNDPDTHHQLGRALDHAGRFEEAIEEFSLARDLRTAWREQEVQEAQSVRHLAFRWRDKTRQRTTRPVDASKADKKKKKPRSTRKVANSSGI